MRKYLCVIALVLTTACSGLQTPTGPTDPGPTVTTVTPEPQPQPPAPEPDPAPAPTPTPTPVPVPPPPPAKHGWWAETGWESWIGVDQLDGHFQVRWAGDKLWFGDHVAEIVLQSNLGIFALLPADNPVNQGKITIAIDDTGMHGSWTWNSLDGQAMGSITFYQ